LLRNTDMFKYFCLQVATRYNFQ